MNFLPSQRKQHPWQKQPLLPLQKVRHHASRWTQRPERLLPRENLRQRSVHQLPPKFPSRCLPRPLLRQFQSWTRSQPYPLLQLLRPSSQPLLLPSYR